MNLALEKRERVTMGGKGRSEIRGETGEVTGVVACAPMTESLGKSYGVFYMHYHNTVHLQDMLIVFMILVYLRTTIRLRKY